MHFLVQALEKRKAPWEIPKALLLMYDIYVFTAHRVNMHPGMDGRSSKIFDEVREGDICAFHSSPVKTSSIVAENAFAIFQARTSDGSYLVFSRLPLATKQDHCPLLIIYRC